MKQIILLAFVFTSFNLKAGNFVAGGNGAMNLAYCNAEDGSFGASVQKDVLGQLTGYSWSNATISEVSRVKFTPAKSVGTPHEKPLRLSGTGFRINVYIGNLPAQAGVPFYRSGEVTIRTNKKSERRQLSCVFFGLDTL